MKRAALLLLLCACSREGSEGATEPPPPASPEPAAPSSATETPDVREGGADGGPSETTAPEPARPPVAPTADCDIPRQARRDEMRSVRSIAYAHDDARMQRVDLAIPKQAEGPYPLVVLVHGGGWRAGERAHMHKEVRALVHAGYAAASVDYRLASATEPGFPRAVGDVRCAISTLRAKAADNDVDPDRVAIVGMSAGGHLAALVATAPDEPALATDCPAAATPPELRGVAAYFTPFDLRASADFIDGTEPVIARFLGDKPADNAERAALASPIVHVDAADPPMLLLHGTADPTVSPEQSRKMRDALREAGVPVAHVELPGAEHGFPMLAGRQELRAATCTTLAFLEAVLEPE